jgi:hypothetical protein
MRLHHPEMFHHRVVPLDKSLRELTRFACADPIANNPVHVHVTPIF